MAENSTIARPYAEALFSAAKDSADSLQGTASHLRLLAELIEMEDVRQAVSDPRLDDAQRCDLVKGLLTGVKLNAHLDNFIELLASNDR